jgi:hypothetical protein
MPSRVGGVTTRFRGKLLWEIEEAHSEKERFDSVSTYAIEVFRIDWPKFLIASGSGDSATPPNRDQHGFVPAKFN